MCVREGRGGGPGGAGGGGARGEGGRQTLTQEKQPTWVAQHQRILLKILQQHHMALSSCQVLTPLRMRKSPRVKFDLLVCCATDGMC